LPRRYRNDEQGIPALVARVVTRLKTKNYKGLAEAQCSYAQIAQSLANAK